MMLYFYSITNESQIITCKSYYLKIPYLFLLNYYSKLHLNSLRGYEKKTVKQIYT
jgi:hypothetical protein